MENESDNDANCNYHAWYSHQMISTENGRFGNMRTNGDHLHYSIVEISQKTERSPGDLRRIAVTSASVESHEITLV